jgi:hypothetical protein
MIAGVPDFANGTAANNLFDPAVQRVVALVKHDREGQFGLRRGDHVQRFDLLGIDAGWLLKQYMNAVLECVDAHLGVKVRRHTNDDCIDGATVQHPQIVVVERSSVLRFDELPRRRPSIADCAELQVGDHAVGDQSGIHRPLHAQANDAEPYLLGHNPISGHLFAERRQSSGPPATPATRLAHRPDWCPFMISSCREGSKKGLVIIGRLKSQQPHRKDLETVACQRSSTEPGL